MAALGVWAVAVGLGDLLAPTDPAGKQAWRLRAAIVAVLVAVLAVGAAIGLGLPELFWLTVVTGTSGALWLWLWQTGREKAALTSLTVGFAALLLLGDAWTTADTGFGRLLAHSPVLPADLDTVALGAGLALLLVSTANRVVRVVLNQVGQDLLPIGNQLRGGRVIGPLERLLIFGLGLSGQLIAAGLVVTAKSLLGYSELRHRSGGNEQWASTSQDRGDSVNSPRPELMSEYLLVGSLVSWSLAFVAIGVAAFALAARREDAVELVGIASRVRAYATQHRVIAGPWIPARPRRRLDHG